MPMIYVSKKTQDLIYKITKHFIKNKSGPTRVVQADVIHAAIAEYAEKLGVVKRIE